MTRTNVRQRAPYRTNVLIATTRQKKLDTSPAGVFFFVRGHPPAPNEKREKMQTTIRGLVATTPQITENGLFMFRLVQPFADELTPPNWFTIICRDGLAERAESLLTKGQRVIVVGTLRVRDWDNGQVSGTSMEIHADTMGHDWALTDPTHTPETWVL